MCLQAVLHILKDNLKRRDFMPENNTYLKNLEEKDEILTEKTASTDGAPETNPEADVPETSPQDFPNIDINKIKKNSVTVNTEPDKKLNWFERTQNWIKEKFNDFINKVKEALSFRKEGGILDKLETRVLGGQEAYNKLYSTPQEVIQSEENSISHIKEEVENSKADNEQENDETKEESQNEPTVVGADTQNGNSIQVNGNNIKFCELNGVKDGSTLVSFSVCSPDESFIKTIANSGKINEESVDEVSDNINSVKKLADKLFDRVSEETPIKGKEFESKSIKGGIASSERFKFDNFSKFQVLHTVDPDGKHYLSGFSEEKAVSFSISGADSYKDAVDKLGELYQSSMTYLDKTKESFRSTEVEEVVENDEPVVDDVITNSSQEPKTDEPETPDADEPVFSEDNINKQLNEAEVSETLAEGEAIDNNSHSEEAVKECQNAFDGILDDDEPVVNVLENTDEPLEINYESQSEINETDDAIRFTSVVQSVDDLKAVNPEVDTSEIEVGDIVEKNKNYYMVTYINPKTDDVSIHSIDYNPKSHNWEPIENSSAQNFKKEAMTDVSIMQKCTAPEFHKGDKVVAPDGTIGTFKDKKHIQVEGVKKAMTIDARTLKLSESGTPIKEEKDSLPDKDETKHKEIKSHNAPNIDFAADNEPEPDDDYDQQLQSGPEDLTQGDAIVDSDCQDYEEL